MLAWMLFSIALGAVLATAALLVEPLARRSGVATRFLWLIAAVTTLAWSAAIAVGGGRSNRGALAATGSLDTALTSTVASESATRQDLGRVRSDPYSTLLPRSNVQLELLLLALWLLGSLACVTTLAFSAWRIARMRHEWTPRLVAGIPVLVSHDVGPAVIGIVHHGIVVPAWIDSLDETSQRLVMLHEREHVRAGDPLLLWGTTLLIALMPWNAALWFILRRVRHAIEIDCDARVLRVQPDAHRYCSLLVDVGGRTLSGVAPAAALAEPTTLLERRVEAMLTRRALGYRQVAGAVGALGLVVAAYHSPHPAGLPGIGVAERAQVERAGPVGDVSRLGAPLPAITRLADTGDATRLVPRPGVGQRSTILRAERAVPPPTQPRPAAVPNPESAQDTIRPVADSVVRQAVAKHFPSALAGGTGLHPYLWFAADREDRVRKSASGREGLIADPRGGSDSVVTWGGASRMLPGVPASARPGDVLFLRAVPAAQDTIMVVWVRLWRGLQASP